MGLCLALQSTVAVPSPYVKSTCVMQCLVLAVLQPCPPWPSSVILQLAFGAGWAFAARVCAEKGCEAVGSHPEEGSGRSSMR